MALSELFLNNRFLIEIVYTLLILVACGFLSFKINSLYQLSGYTGLRLFRNTFIFFGLAFFVRFFMHQFMEYGFILYLVFGTLIGIAGFSLLHSMLWKRWPYTWTLYPLALVFPLLDMFTTNYIFLYMSQIALFTYLSLLAWRRYVPNRRGYGQLYLITMVLFWLGWVTNFIGQMLMQAFPGILFNVYAITLGIFVIFVFAIGRLHRW